MQRNTNSDMSMIADAVFNDLIETIMNSKLNFQLKLTPYSAHISLKKSLQKDTSGSYKLPTLVEKNVEKQNLQSEIKMLRSICEKSS